METSPLVEVNPRVSVGSTVVVEVYIARVGINHSGRRRKFFEYERHLQNGKADWVQTFLITEDPTELSRNPKALHPGSFAGRALLGAVVGQEIEVNIGGLSIDDLRVGHQSGNHLKYKIVAIENV